ncbi:MAG TPA: NADH-quinone oxidoreductase subunit J [Ktedonosporobacter sp.]|nr:NADH-quinone oxidoreductase subunit J [Ktedonosporobacter sp.]
MDIGTTITFFVLAIASMASAIGVIAFKNAVNSALSMILTLVFLAMFYLQLNAMFIAIVQILIYAGAIMVLFLFVVTMLAPDQGDVGNRDPMVWQRGVATTLGIILVGALSYLIYTTFTISQQTKATGANSLSQVATKQGDIQAFGQALFHGFVFPFEVTSLLIVIAILGALIFGRRA